MPGHTPKVWYSKKAYTPKGWDTKRPGTQRAATPKGRPQKAGTPKCWYSKGDRNGGGPEGLKEALMNSKLVKSSGTKTRTTILTTRYAIDFAPHLKMGE